MGVLLLVSVSVSVSVYMYVYECVRCVCVPKYCVWP